MKKRERRLEEWALRRRERLGVLAKKRDHAHRRRYGETSTPSVTKGRFGRRSKVIQLLASTSRERLKASKREVTVDVPPTLSIIESPEAVVRLVGAFAKALHDTRIVRRIVFNHRNLKHYDLAGNALLDIVASEFNDQHKVRRSRKRLQSKGSLPDDLAVRRFIRAIGIIKHLDVKHEAPSEQEASRLKVFDVRKKYYSPEKVGAKASTRDRTTRKFVDHINDCLKKNGRLLTRDGVQRLVEYLGEILNNAEDHAGFKDWTLQGYLDDTTDVAMCEIAIFNFGRSIAQTLAALDRATSYTWEQIGPYLDTHLRAGLLSPQWREEDLLTVMALQPDVSCKNNTNADTRGQGTVDLMQFFQSVYEECSGAGDRSARMAILSGSTYIKFDGTYKLASSPKTSRQQIAFNTENDLEQRPDKSYVRSLGLLHFPGTIISVKFPLASANLVGESSHGKESEED